MVRKAVGTPILFFSSQLDVNVVTEKLNRGRLALYDDLGHIGHWIFSTSIESKQGANSWEKVGGVITPNFELPDENWYEVNTKLVTQPNQPVKEYFLILYKGSNAWSDKKGNKRSEILVHEDSNYSTSPGTLGCLGALPGQEWADFKRVFAESCGHLESVRLAVSYTY